MQSKAVSVDQYLAELPPDRREALATVRKVILANLDPTGFAEGILYGMIGYYVPHAIYPPGYHCNPKLPLPYAALGSQKNYMSLHLMSVYGEGAHGKWFREAWMKTGKQLDMGKACIRFKHVEDLPLEVIGEAIRRVPAKVYLENYQRALQRRPKASTKRPKVAKSPRQPSRGAKTRPNKS